MAGTELTPDQKGQASLTLGDVIVKTRENFPDSRFHPIVHSDSKQYHRFGINTHGYESWLNNDGAGTKLEAAERLFSEDDDPSHFETLAFNAFAMVEEDVYRNGEFMLGIAHVIDMNDAQDHKVISELVKGTRRACDEGRFALLNGETAELGYRSSGYGKTRINWNAVGYSIHVPEKFISGKELRPSQPLVALREPSLRSNGYSRARKILETDYVYGKGFQNLADYVMGELNGFVGKKLDRFQTIDFLNNLLGHDFLEQVLVPWHKERPEVAKELLAPATLYGRLMYEALGGISSEKVVDITGAAHISGGGVPEKGKRMVEDFGLGLAIDSRFPDPKAVTLLMAIADGLPDQGRDLIDDRTACEQWNRGIGFMVATRTLADADRFIQLAGSMGYEAAIAGEVTNKKEVNFKGYTWTYV